MAMTISERGIDRKNSILCVGEELGGMHTSALFSSIQGIELFI